MGQASKLLARRSYSIESTVLRLVLGSVVVYATAVCAQVATVATGTSYPSGIGTVVTTAGTDMPWDLTIGFVNGSTTGTLLIQGFTVSTDTLTVEPGSACILQ
jgi:hypothetical protein